MVVLNHQYGLGRTVTARYFGTGDGSRVAFNLAGMDSDVAYVAPAIYKSDWAGNSLLYSTARTNLALQSQTLGTTWVPTSLSVSANVATPLAPDGTQTADKLVEDGLTSSKYIDQTRTAAVSAVHTASVYLRADGRSVVQLQVYSSPGFAEYAFINVDLSTGALSSPATAGGATQTYTSTSVGNGWWRISQTVTLGGVGTGIMYRLRLGTVSYLGDSASGVDAWGAMLEVASASTPTSYIPTTTIAVSVTDYSLHATSGAVTFASAPAANSTLAYKQPWAPSSNVFMRFGTGDGTSTVFSLPYAPVVPAIYVGGVLKTVVTDYTVAPSGVCTFTSAPAAAAVLTWTGAMGPMP